MTFSFNVHGLTPADAQTSGSGGGGGGTTEPVVLPKNVMGLDYIIDGEYNLPLGSDHTNMNIYNLVKPSYTSTVNGQKDITNGAASFSDKSFKAAGTLYAPNFKSDEWSWDIVIKQDSAPLDFWSNAYLIHINSGASSGGYSIHINTAENVKALCFMGSSASTTNVSKVYAYNFWSPNEICYFTITSNAVTGETKLYKNGEEASNYDVNDAVAYKINSAATNTGILGACSTTTVSDSSNIPTSESGIWSAGSFLNPTVDIYAIRHWNRILTPEEIKQNYNNDKRRFG